MGPRIKSYDIFILYIYTIHKIISDVLGRGGVSTHLHIGVEALDPNAVEVVLSVEAYLVRAGGELLGGQQAWTSAICIGVPVGRQATMCQQ